MDIDQKIQNAANDFQNTIYDLLKQVIDEGILFSESNQYDEVDTFLYVINLLENKYKMLASIFNTATSEYDIWLMEHYPDVESKIDDYIEPLVEKACKRLQSIISVVLESNNYGELAENYTKIDQYLTSKGIKKYDYLLDGLKIGLEFIPKKEERQVLVPRKNNF